MAAGSYLHVDQGVVVLVTPFNRLPGGRGASCQYLRMGWLLPQG